MCTISRGNCWAAHTICHHNRIFNVPEIRVWVRTDDLHFKSLTILLLVLPLPKQTNDDYDMTGHDKDNDEYKLNLLLNQRLLNAVKMLVISRKEP